MPGAIICPLFGSQTKRDADGFSGIPRIHEIKAAFPHILDARIF